MLEQKQNTNKFNDGDVVCLKFRDMTEYVGIYREASNTDVAQAMIHIENPHIVHIVSSDTQSSISIRDRIELEPFYKTASNNQIINFDKLAQNILTVFKTDNTFTTRYLQLISDKG